VQKAHHYTCLTDGSYSPAFRALLADYYLHF